MRWQVLRAPWEQPRGSERDEFEDTADHLAVFQDDKVIATGRLHEIAAHTGQIRYMAVNPQYVRKGLGSTVLHSLEAIARGKNYRVIELDARDTALNFYRHHGYERISSSPTKWGIPHHRMRKLLQSDGTFTVP